MGLKSSLYMLVLQLIVICLFVFLFLVVMLIIVGNTPVSILFTGPGLFLQLILIVYFWIVLFAIPNKSSTIKTKKSKEYTTNLAYKNGRRE